MKDKPNSSIRSTILARSAFSFAEYRWEGTVRNLGARRSGKKPAISVVKVKASRPHALRIAVKIPIFFADFCVTYKNENDIISMHTLIFDEN